MIRSLRTLDGYVVRSWLRIFVLTAIGFPVVAILISLTDELRKLLDRGLSVGEILISYGYSLPENIFLVMPAAVLFASVFTVGAMGRHSEITAAKAGGVSFHRLSLPIFVCAALATALAVLIGEVAPGATAKQLEIQKGDDVRPTSVRYDSSSARAPGSTIPRWSLPPTVRPTSTRSRVGESGTGPVVWWWMATRMPPSPMPA